MYISAFVVIRTGMAYFILCAGILNFFFFSGANGFKIPVEPKPGIN